MATAADDYALRAVPAVEQALGYHFREPRCLLQALTHRSFSHENLTESGDFDELEWLGDSVLQLAVSSWLFRSARGSRRSAHQLTLTRQRFVDAGACETFAIQLNLVPFLRIGQRQPVKGTKILADCFEAVLGAVYVDADSDLQPVHNILGRVIPSYNLGTRSNQPPLASPPRNCSPEIGQEPGQKEEPRKLMNLTHRLVQIAKRGAVSKQAGSTSSAPSGVVQPDYLEVLQDFHRRLRLFQESSLRTGTLSFSTESFAGMFGSEVAEFYESVAADPVKHVLLDQVLAGSTNLRKHFPDAPQKAEGVVMQVVPIPSELRLQCFTVAEFLLLNVLRQNGSPDQSALRLLESVPNGGETVALLRRTLAESASCLLFTSHQRSVLASGLTGQASSAALHTPVLPPSPMSDEDSRFYLGPPPMKGLGRLGRGRGRGRGHPHGVIFGEPTWGMAGRVRWRGGWGGRGGRSRSHYER